MFKRIDPIELLTASPERSIDGNPIGLRQRYAVG